LFLFAGLLYDKLSVFAGRFSFLMLTFLVYLIILMV
jgi:hypothetical protein